MSVVSLLNRTCSVWEIEYGASDGVGGFAKSDTTGAADSTGVRCRIQQASASDVKQFERLDHTVNYVLYAKASAPIERGWALKIDGTDAPGSDIELEVIDVDHPSVPTHHMKVLLETKKRRP